MVYFFIYFRIWIWIDRAYETPYHCKEISDPIPGFNIKLNEIVKEGHTILITR